MKNQRRGEFAPSATLERVSLVARSAALDGISIAESTAAAELEEDVAEEPDAIDPGRLTVTKPTDAQKKASDSPRHRRHRRSEVSTEPSSSSTKTAAVLPAQSPNAVNPDVRSRTSSASIYTRNGRDSTEGSTSMDSTAGTKSTWFAAGAALFGSITAAFYYMTGGSHQTSTGNLRAVCPFSALFSNFAPRATHGNAIRRARES